MKVDWGWDEKDPNHKQLRQQNRSALGVILLILGVIGLAYLHSMRPPEDLGDAIGMLFNNRDRFIKEPYYSIGMAISGVTAIVGAIMFVIGMSNRKDDV